MHFGNAFVRFVLPNFKLNPRFCKKIRRHNILSSAGAYRFYALSRIKNIKITKEQFTISEGFDINKEVDLSFGTAVEVIAPESLRKEIVQNARKVIGKYEG